MYHSTTSSLDTKDSLSSDEDGDIYRHPGRDSTTCAPNETSDRRLAPDVLNRGSHKPDQVGAQHQFEVQGGMSKLSYDPRVRWAFQGKASKLKSQQENKTQQNTVEALAFFTRESLQR